MKEPVRTRFAPSPTGHLHIGNARTAVMNWLFSRHANGRFILRIEDTDRERSADEFERSILEDLRWLRLHWDEGPDVGGDFGPYRQSERSLIYMDCVKKLENTGKIYSCYCTPEELEVKRQRLLSQGLSPYYDGHCRKLSSAEKKRLENEGRKPAFRFRVDDEDVMFNDLVKGAVSFSGEHIGDFLIMRPDYTPMYNFACVIDDHLMEISHVIRGDDHVSNTPRQLIIYRAFGWTPPDFAHIPMIMGKDRERLSKRYGATSVSQYRELGYLPEVLVNFLSLLSWSSESGDEILSINRLIHEFDLHRVSKAASIFNVEKLDWMNGVYIRDLDVDRLTELILPFLKRSGYLFSSIQMAKSIVAVLQDKLERLSEIEEKAKIFFQEDVVPENREAEEILRNRGTKNLLSNFLKETSDLKKWDVDTFKTIMKRIQEQTGVKAKNLWMPIRVALTGQIHGPDLSKVVEILGYEKCQKLINRALEQYG